MESCRRALVSSSSADPASADSVALTWAGVALGALLLCGCTRAGFSVSGEAGPADGAVEAGPPDQGAVDRGVTEAAAPDIRPGCPTAPAHAWSRGIGAVGKDYAVGVAVDESGNVYLTGMFSGSADFGDGKPLSSANGSGDIFVASYTAKGAHRWSKRFGDTGEDGGDDVWIDASGNVYVAGSFSGGVDFGGPARVGLEGVPDHALRTYGFVLKQAFHDGEQRYEHAVMRARRTGPLRPLLYARAEATRQRANQLLPTLQSIKTALGEPLAEH